MTTFLQRLEAEFKDENKKERYTTATQLVYKTSGLTRAFDKLPFLLSPAAMKTTCENFKNIVRGIRHSEQDVAELTESDKTNIEKYILSITSLACHELLDEKGQVHSDIVTLIRGEHCQDELLNTLTVCAFISAVHKQMIKPEMYQELGDNKMHACLSYLNENYRPWVIKTMQYLKIPVNVEIFKAKTLMMKLVEYTDNHPVIAASVVTVAGGLIGLGALGACQLLRWMSGPSISQNALDLSSSSVSFRK